MFVVGGVSVGLMFFLRLILLKVVFVFVGFR